jgi:glycerate kinase
MNILVAPNAFKGCLNALQVADAIQEGIQKALPYATVVKTPIADGGEGTVEIFIGSKGGTLRSMEVTNAVGEKITASYGILQDGKKTAILEISAASGLGQLDPSRLSPMTASSFGTGQLILDALDQGCRRIILGLGGSATNDAGTGLMSALGVKFLNESGWEIPKGGGGLAYLESIDTSGVDPRILECEVIVPCDVSNPLLGEFGSAKVYAQQKGATKEQIELLEANLAHFAEIVLRDKNVDISSIQYGGAAGGASAGLHGLIDARLVGGTDFMLHLIGFEEKLKEANFLITAEGRLDIQSLEGKGPYGAARRARVREKPVFCITGQIEPGFEAEQFEDFQAIFPIATGPMSLEESIERAPELLTFTAWQIGKMLALV